MSLYIGLMSGTSMDGIDAALIDLPSHRLLLGITQKYSDELKLKMDELLCGTNLTLASICQLNTLIGKEFANTAIELLNRAKINTDEVKAIGSHGQTLCHDPFDQIPYTLQLGCAHTIATLTGITVVADFRTRDLVNGGQGAPFAPLYHQELFTHTKDDIALVNIGGIANCTFITKNGFTQGWDIGPGNCLMDAWCLKHLGNPYDADGKWAQQGKVIEPLLDCLLTDKFFSLKSPKSIGKEYFSLDWLMSFLKKEYKAVDIQATLLALTAQSIAQTMVMSHTKINKLYLCGGGTHNSQLRQMLSQLLPQIKVSSSAEVGIDPDYLEAMMFGWLASQTLNKIPLDLSAITGSKQPSVLGAIYL